MNKFENFSVVLDQFVQMYPRDISVFVGLHKGNCLFHDDTSYCRFQFSKGGKFRNPVLFKKDFSNTVALYDSVLNEFLKSWMISFGYDTVKIENEYQGLRLRNMKEEQLNIYFSKDMLSEYQKTIDFLQQRKQQDFFNYCSRAISRRIVKEMTIRPAVDDRSGVIYIFDNDETSPSLKKDKQLGYYYRQKDGVVDPGDMKLILDLIRLFINCNLDQEFSYNYQLNSNLQTDKLCIHCSGGEKIEIIGDNLIYPLEKEGVIDDLHKVIHHEIDKMPKQIRL